jgi:hypothetical protein
MRNDVCLLSTVEQSTIESVVDLVAELVAAELDTPRWVKLGHQNGKSLPSEGSATARKYSTPNFSRNPRIP